MTKTPMQTLLDEYGSKAGIGRLLGISRGAVSAWGEKVPCEHAITLEVKTEGRFKAIELTGASS